MFKYASTKDIEIPEGWERCGMMDGSHTIDRDGVIRPYQVPIGGPHSILEIANALHKLEEVQIRRVGYDRFKRNQPQEPSPNE